MQAGVGLAVSVFGQSLVEPERIPAVREFFATAPSAPPLRCEINPVRPSLNFGFRFQAGYTVDIPFAQFHGSGHGLTAYARVTPQGREPVYMMKTEALPEAPETDVDAVTGGAFVVGEGTYGLEVLVEDDLHRNCRGSWQIQARRGGSERQLNQTTPPGTVEELSGIGPRTGDAKPGPRIGRITILVHAAPLSPNLSSLQPDDVRRVVDSLSSLLRELPAQSVRLIAFNLEQRAVIFRKDGFAASQNGELAAALNQLELGVLDYRILRDRPEPMDLLLGLVQAELQDPQPPDALIVLGPPTPMHEDVRPDALGKRLTAAPPVFDLQYRFDRPLPPWPLPPRRGPNSRVRTSDALTMPDPPMPAAPRAQGTFGPLTDTIENLVSRLKGQTIPVSTPHDLADAIQRMEQRIPKTAPPPAVTAKVGPSVNAETPAREAAPPPAASPSPNRPAREADSSGNEDPVEVLMRLRDQVLERGERIPNYTCVESMQRDRYEPVAGRAPKSCDTLLARRKQADFQGRLKLNCTDWLRLDVAYAGGSEIYSWAGASKFEEGELEDLVPEGATGTGPFATMLLAIFEPRFPKYVFEGETAADGRRVFEYSFVVPQDQSHYRVKAHKEWIVTGYTGSLLVDPKTAELVRLAVRTEELPAATNTCEVDTSLEYGIVQLGGGDYLLPKVARQRFIGRDGSEAENTMTFAACREYQAESKVAFGVGAPIDGGQLNIPAATLGLPAGLPVSVQLITEVRFGRAAAGDVIKGRLLKPIRDQRQMTVVPEGAAVQGRLMRVETGYARGIEHTVALRWEAVQVGGAMEPLALLPNRRSADLRTGAGSGLRSRGMEIELPLPGEGRYGVFHLPGGRDVLESGFRTEWFTAKP
jgi:hypothetical protein